ncbi:MAG: redox-regulated ATPase YchF [Planctomycetes bacterium]|nr:redox-regulated ATPase YchF [Planctomycetota bacterium]
MRIGIVGWPQSGKRTLFSLLTGKGIPAGGTDRAKAVPGTAAVHDPRFEELVDLYRPRKRTPAQIAIDLLPDLDERRLRDAAFIEELSKLDAICHVVRAFRDDAVYHVSGSVNPERDVEAIQDELLLLDLLHIEKRLERIAQDARRGKAAELPRERACLERLRAHLDAGAPFRTFPISEEERRILAGHPFLSGKETIIAWNDGEDPRAAAERVSSLLARYGPRRVEIMPISAKIEAEIAQLESEDDRRAFLSDCGLDEPALHRLTRRCMAALGRISFFTVGTDEVRQWLVRRGATAPEAAGVIHSDLERGFIRAEVTKYADLIAHGSEERVKQAGKLVLAGRDYRVEDGDILSIRFSV